MLPISAIIQSMKKPLNILTSLLFIGILLSLGIVNILNYDKSNTSNAERRALATFPEFNVDSLLEDGYASRFESALKDRFFWRDEMIQIVRYTDRFQGFGMKVAQYKGSENPTTISNSRMAQYYKTDIGWLFAYISSPENEKTYTESIAHFAEEHPNYHVLNMLIPNKAAFFYDESVNYSDDQVATTIAIENELQNRGVNVISTYENMLANDPLAMYFMTDHHWNGYGVLIAYNDFCKFYQKNHTAKEKENQHNEFHYTDDLLEHHLEQGTLTRNNLRLDYYEGFVGSLFAQTNDPEMIAHPDTMLVYSSTIPHYYYGWSRINSIEETRNFPEPLPQAVSPTFFNELSYGMYLGGDKGLVIVRRRTVEQEDNTENEEHENLSNAKETMDSSQKTPSAPETPVRKILIIKDSYGNALSALLINMYDELHIIDPRYFNASVPEYLTEHSISTILFLNAVNVTKNKDYVEAIEHILSEGGK